MRIFHVQRPLDTTLVAGGHNGGLTSRILVSRGSSGTDDIGDVAIGIAVPGIMALLAGATLLYLIIRHSRRKGAGEEGLLTSFWGTSLHSVLFVKFTYFVVTEGRLTGRKHPVEVVKAEPTRIRDTLTLRQLNTHRFLVAPPRRQNTAAPLDSTTPHCEQHVQGEPQAGPSTTRRRSLSSRISRASSNPFSDTHTPQSPSSLSAPPSAMLRSHISLDYDGALIDWDPAASPSHDPFIDPHSQSETASTPPSASAPSIIGSASLAEHTVTESTPPTPRSDDFGYLSDATMSTLPPSYRTNRPNVPRVPPLPTPPSASAHDTITAPPSAFTGTTRGRRRSMMHGPRAPSSAQQPGVGVAGQRQTGDEVNGDCSDESGRQSGGTQTRRKSEDGGVRLAGGPLVISEEDRVAIEGGSEELGPPPMYEGSRRMPKEKA